MAQAPRAGAALWEGVQQEMGRSLRIGLLIVLGVCLAGWIPVGAAGASAPEGPAEEQLVRGEKASVTTGPIITSTTIPQAPGTWGIQGTGFLAVTAGRFSPSWRRVGAGGDFLSLATPLQITYGLAPRTEIYTVIQYQHNWAAQVDHPGPGGERSANFSGLGDISLAYKHLLLEEKPSLPAVSGIFTVNFPAGHHGHLNPRFRGTDQLGRGAYTFTPGINVYKYLAPVLLYGNLWYSMSTDATVAGQRRHYRDQVILNLAAEYPLSQRLVFLLEYVSFYDGGRLLGPRANQPPGALMSLLPALEFIVSDDLSFAGGVVLDLWGKNARYNYTPVLAVFVNLR
jgi:hypothetical protein